MQRLYCHPHFMAAQTIMLFNALPDEPATLPLLDALCAEGRTILLPRVTSDTDMELRRYTGTKDLKRGAFGIMEPTGALFTDYEKIEVVIVPGMAFDAAGRRLGRGRGYYDRFLSTIPQVHKIGVCFPFQRVAEVPTEDHDERVDEVCS